MGMSIDDCISELTWVRKVNEEILKADAKEIDIDSAWIKHWENVVKSLDVSIATMRKYQKIEEIVNDRYGKPVFKTLDEVIKVVENGNDK